MNTTVETNPAYRQRVAAVCIPLAVAALILLTGFSLQAGLAVALLAAAFALAVLLARHFDYALLLLFLLIAWFPEYSQTDVNVWSAEDFHSLYNYRPFAAITASVFDYIFLVIVLVWVWKVVIPQGRRVFNPPLVGRVAAVFLGVCVWSLFYGLLRGNRSYDALREFRVSCYFVLTLWMCVTSISYQTVVRHIPRLLLILAVVISIFGIARHARGIGRIYYGYHLIYYDIADSILIFVTLLTLLSLGLVRRNKQHLLLAVPLIYTLVFSFRRGAWVGFAIGVLVVLLLGRASTPRKVPLFRLVLVLVLLLAVGGATLSSSKLGFIGQRLASITDITGEEDPSNLFRIMDALNAINAFAAHPVFGVGFGGRYALKYYSEAVAPPEFWEAVNKTSHDGYLFVLYKMGAVGFLAYAALLAAFLTRWFRARRGIPRGETAALFLAMGASFIAIMTTNITSPVTDSLRSAIMLAFVMGIAAVIYQHHRQERE